MLSFQGLVAVVTGAGGGLGRIYSLELGKRGAKVVVNDLGGLRDGKGQDNSAANKVVWEINNLGGTAIANYDSVENGDNIIQTAINKFGKIDILINNAGILRDKSFARMSDSDWNNVINVHLNGAFKTTKKAWEHMKNQNFGRIIFTTSASGLYGNFGQANYSAAKSGLIGLSKSLSIEGLKYNIHCNAIAPVAGSRMTEDIFPPDVFDSLKPDFVAPLVLYLCHPSCEETGSVFEVGGGWIGKVQLEVSKGQLLKNSPEHYFLPEDVKENWNSICDFENSNHPISIRDSISNVMDNILVKEKPQFNSLEEAIGFKISKEIKKYTFKDFILYASSVGVDEINKNTLKFLYENHDYFTCLPTFHMIPAFDLALEMFQNLTQLFNDDLDLSQVLHGEQYLEVYKPIVAGEVLSGKVEVVDVLDKKVGVVLVVQVQLFNNQKEKLSDSQMLLFINGMGNYGGKRTSEKVVNTKVVPTRSPDKVMEKAISLNQASLYRLNGDLNPIHIDPELADAIGFKKPILHGLCGMGLIGYQVLSEFADFQVHKFKKIKLRFSNPVYPGITLVSEYWNDRNGTIQFQCKDKETGKVCISGGYVELDETPKTKL